MIWSLFLVMVYFIEKNQGQSYACDGVHDIEFTCHFCKNNYYYKNLKKYYYKSKQAAIKAMTEKGVCSAVEQRKVGGVDLNLYKDRYCPGEDKMKVKCMLPYGGKYNSRNVQECEDRQFSHANKGCYSRCYDKHTITSGQLTCASPSLCVGVACNSNMVRPEILDPAPCIKYDSTTEGNKISQGMKLYCGPQQYRERTNSYFDKQLQQYESGQGKDRMMEHLMIGKRLMKTKHMGSTTKQQSKTLQSASNPNPDLAMRSDYDDLFYDDGQTEPESYTLIAFPIMMVLFCCFGFIIACGGGIFIGYGVGKVMEKKEDNHV